MNNAFIVLDGTLSVQYVMKALSQFIKFCPVFERANNRLIHIGRQNYLDSRQICCLKGVQSVSEGGTLGYQRIAEAEYPIPASPNPRDPDTILNILRLAYPQYDISINDYEDASGKMCCEIVIKDESYNELLRASWDETSFLM